MIHIIPSTSRMRTHGLKALFSALVVPLTACGLVLGSGTVSKEATSIPSNNESTAYVEGPATNIVPAAACGPGSNPQPPTADANSSTEYWCNLERVSQLLNEGGGNWGFATFEDCAYWTMQPPETAAAPGVVVAEVSDSAKPVQTALLETVAMADPHESLKINERRALLAAVQEAGEGFDVYDVSGDCAHPTLKATTEFAGTFGHEGNWTPDGLTYYGSGGAPGVYAIDTEDPAMPELAGRIDWSTHGLSFSDDGRRAYLASIETNENAPVAEVAFGGGYGNNASFPNALAGLVIVDVSEIQDRKPNPKTRIISELYAADAVIIQMNLAVSIKQKPYVIHVAEGTGGIRIIDISDETAPRTVSQIYHNPYLNADGSAGIAPKTTHYCGVDQSYEATAIACGNFVGNDAIRVYDIRDPATPKEIAYYNPQDNCAASIEFKKGRGELWTMCKAKGLQVLRFTNGAWPFKDGT